MLCVNLLQEPLRLPPAESIADERTELLGPVDVSLGMSDLFEELGRNLHANDRSVTHGLLLVTLELKLSVILGTKTQPQRTRNNSPSLA